MMHSFIAQNHNKDLVMKYYSLVIVASTCLLLTGCGSEDEESTGTSLNLLPPQQTTPVVTTANTTAAAGHTFETFSELDLEAINRSDNIATVAIADENDNIIFRTMLQPAQQKMFSLTAPAGDNLFTVQWVSYDSSIDSYNTLSRQVSDISNALSFEGFY